jgi:hypothetical protein
MKSLALALRPLLKDVEKHRTERRFKGERFPDRVWSKAGELAAVYGVDAVAEATKLEAKKIKQLSAPQHSSGPTFVEWTGPCLNRPLHCLLELESRLGDKMKIDVNLDISELSALTADFFSR